MNIKINYFMDITEYDERVQVKFHMYMRKNYDLLKEKLYKYPIIIGFELQSVTIQSPEDLDKKLRATEQAVFDHKMRKLEKL